MQAFRDLLRGSLARSLHSWTEEDRLAAALPLVCGSALASRCSVHHRSPDGTLHLQVEGSEWAAVLEGMRERFRCDLQRVAGVPVPRLHFLEAKPRMGRPAPATNGYKELSRPTPESLPTGDPHDREPPRDRPRFR